MASISSLSSSSSSSSIYGSNSYNIISGLASGLDTESMIEGLVQSYQQKIQSLQQDNTKLQWKQEAYQSISNKLVEFSRNYTSYVYSSNTNLASSSFFSKAVITTPKGNNASLVSASGKSSSNIVLNSVKELASAARYTTDRSRLAAATDSTTGSKMDLEQEVTISKLKGTLTFTYGNEDVSISFGEQEFFEEDGKFSAAKFEEAINNKLKEQQITVGGTTYTADERIKVSVSQNGTISVSDKKNAGNSVYISDATGTLGDMVNMDENEPSNNTSIQLKDTNNLTENVTAQSYLKGKSISVTLDGVSKNIKLPEIGDDTTPEEVVDSLNAALDEAFGAGKAEFTLDDQGILSINVTDTNSRISVSTSDSVAGQMLGIGTSLTNYLDTNKTLGELGVDFTGLVSDSEHDGKYELKINDKVIGYYNEDTKLSEVLDDINSNTDAGVSVSYSKLTDQLVFTANNTGTGGHIDILADSLGEKLFGNTVNRESDGGGRITSDRYQEGVDAEFSVTVNGDTMVLKRSSNTVDLDGMTVTLNGTFNEEIHTDDGKINQEEFKKLTTNDKVSFSISSDADTIVNAVKQMVDDFNAMMTEVKQAYSDMPLQQSNGSRYEPLTDDDMADMSESAIEKYEEKAKTGILFMDSDLSSLYNDLRNIITSDSATLKSIGLTSSYSDGQTTLSFDEQAFREALQADPDKVQEVFTKSVENGASRDGLMASIKNITERYAATTGDVKGILIEKAGSKYSPTAALDNDILDQMQDIEDQISKWEDKMSNQVDYYTNKFTQLELLINQMNSQSSSLASMMGGY